MITTSINKRTRNRTLEIAEARYTVRLARNEKEVESALLVRFEVFKREMGAALSVPGAGDLEFDAYDFTCEHLIVVENSTGRTVGTYRLNSIETALNARGFYSYGEFNIETLPTEVLEQGVEIGRACVLRDHRNARVLFLLWKGLAAYLGLSGKRFLFGCCSIFTTDASVGARAHRQLIEGGHLHQQLTVAPRANGISCDVEDDHRPEVKLPNLFQMYLRMGAKICGPPMIDREFGTIDFFVVFDAENLDEKYRAMFFPRS